MNINLLKILILYILAYKLRCFFFTPNVYKNEVCVCVCVCVWRGGGGGGGSSCSQVNET